MDVNSGNALNDFLLRNPWTTHDMMSKALGKRVLDLSEKEGARERKSIDVADIGLCYARREEPESGLHGIHRLNMVRKFVLSVMGGLALSIGLSPSLTSDGEFFWNNTWWRIWGDLGFAAPEALKFVQSPPSRYGPGVRDLILVSNKKRMEFVYRQIEHRWGGENDVFVWVVEDNAHRILHPVRKKTSNWRSWSDKEVIQFIEQRQSAEPMEIHTGKIAAQMTSLDWQILTTIGDNPLLSRQEIVHILSVDESQTTVKRSKYSTELLRKKKVNKRIEFLDSHNFFKEPRMVDLIGRIIPSWQAMKFLASYWGITFQDMARFHPWPQTKESKRGKQAYSTRWLGKMLPHQTLCRQFSLALLFGGRSISTSYGGIDVNLVTTIGSRLLYQQGSGRDKTKWVIPDGFLRAEIWRSFWDSGLVGPKHVTTKHGLFIEIDRATNPLTRLDDRFDRYQQVWPALAGENPVLVWVIDGTPHREKYILDGMKDRGLIGWTVLLERLCLKKSDSWWLRHPTNSPFEIEYEATGGMSVYRDIWMSTESGSDYIPFLGREPWSQDNLKQ